MLGRYDMPNIWVGKFGFLIIYSLVFAQVGCKNSSEMDRLQEYLSSINAQEGTLPPAGGGAPVNLPKTLSGSSATVGNGTSIIGGTPRVIKDGFCGDGIINGPTEDCDQGAIQNTDCRDYNGLNGIVRCQENCLYDISDCMTEKTNREIGGLAETCKCHCDTNACNGGCTPLGAIGQSTCTYDCRSDCICQCQGKMSAHVEACDIRCACSVDLNGNPDCNCTLESCDLVTTITPNIANITGNFGLVGPR